MKAAILVETNKPLEIHDIELESLNEGEVLIKMVAAGVCHSDHHAMVGHTSQHAPPLFLVMKAQELLKKLGQT